MRQFYSISILILFITVNATGQEGWTRQATPYSSGLSAVYAIDSLNVWATGQDGLIIHTTDGGTTWDSIPNGATQGIYTVEFINADTGFVGGRDNGPGALVGTNTLIQRTTDGGLTWEFQNLPGGSQNLLMDLDFVEGPPGEPMRGTSVGGLAHVWVTNDYGETWEAASGDCGEGNFNSCFFADSITGWFVGTPSNVKPYTIMFTDDGCKSFAEQTDPNEVKLNGVCFGTDLKGLAVGNSGAILFTSDGGANWEQSADEDISVTTWFSVFLSATGKAWAVGNNGRILYSTDWGQTWETQESGVTEPLWEVHFINDNEGWIVGGFSENVILHTKNGGGTSAGTGVYNDERTKAYSLEQNHPNPFSTSTQISYRLTRSNHVTLIIYDISGRKIQTLVNEFQIAGEHKIEWDAGHLSNGLYFYELVVAKYSGELRKMVLAK
jgi:photosystem II stability/assembly factor-like uncharacterized protein